MTSSLILPPSALHNASFIFPPSSLVCKVLPKSKIYEHSKPGNAVKELFVKQVDKIIWQYKLAPETINLPAKPSVPEIQVFTITLKTQELSEGMYSPPPLKKGE